MIGRTMFPDSRTPKARRGPARDRPAFTLLESLLALVIIGVGVLAFVDAQSAFTRSNNWSSQAATGMLLANEIRELSRRLPRHDPVTGLTLIPTGGGTTAQGWGSENGETTIEDIDDLDDLDGKVFGSGGSFPGPIDGFGMIVPAIGLDGSLVSDAEGEVMPIAGWRQYVTVQKVDPYNFGVIRAPEYQQTSNGVLPAISADKFPLRVTVVVTYTMPGTTEELEITRLTWIVPA